MALAKRVSRQLAAVHRAAFKWSIRSATFSSFERRIMGGAVLARCCLLQGPQMFALLSFPGVGSGGRFVQCHRLASHEKVGTEVRLEVRYVLLVDQTEATRVGASVHRHVHYHCKQAIEGFSSCTILPKSPLTRSR